MRHTSSFGIGKKLYAVALGLSVVLAGVGLSAYIHLNSVVDLAQRTRELRVPQLQRVAALELNVTRVSLQLRHAMLARTPAEQDEALADVGRKRQLIAAAAVDYDKALLTPESQALFAKVPQLLRQFWEAGDANITLISGGHKAEAFAFLVDRTIPARNALLAALKDNVDAQESRLSDDIHSLETQARQTLYVLLASVLGVMVGLMLFSWYVAGLLRQRVAVSCAVAERVRDGDLSAAVQDDAHDEFTPLLAALQEMQQSLTRVVADVRVNAERVSLASSEIATGNLDLSQRTELQASALQQTSATMDELGATVSNNADNAQQARRMAEGASGVAAQGGEVVAQVIATMRDINASSRQIHDIIGVIDGIAFQTNILSLNAAVEAARAGEQGRGFAVVAGEVRSLAQRSAEAARQIKTLITASVARVEHGSTLVGQAGETMGHIVSAIQRVTGIVGEISTASAEQSTGIRQVGDAINQMDKATQQNVALVEQSTAAADGLKERAQALVRSVAVFKLPGKAP